MKFSGKISVFGGPRDTGVSPSEGLALFEPSDLADPNIKPLFLPQQPEGTTGLARRLDPSQFYIACRWDYEVTPKKLLRASLVRVTASNGKSAMARPADWGPNKNTSRVADTSPALADYLGLKTDDVVTVEGPFPLDAQVCEGCGESFAVGFDPEGVPLCQACADAPSEISSPIGAPSTTASQSPAAPSDPAGGSRVFEVGADHWLVGVKREPIEGGSELLTRRCVVEHFTGGATAMSSIEAMKTRSVSAHVVVDRDGTVYQCRPFNRKADHAGPSKWSDPKTGQQFSGLNGCALGIEIANAGDDPGALSWARKQQGFQSVQARHRNGGSMEEWEVFYEPQIAAVIGITQALVKRYNLDDVTGHDCIAPDRKNDPGPAFPMEKVRLACGFSGLPAVHH